MTLPPSVIQQLRVVSGHQLLHPADCEWLMLDIESRTGVRIGATTLKRLLGFVADERDTIATQAPAQPGPESALQPVLQPEVTPPAPAANSTERLRAEVRNTVLPHFNATVGAMPDSVEPGGQQWADACSALEPLLEQSLKSLIASHPNISMETVAKEFNDYVNALMTLKMNQAKK